MSDRTSIGASRPRTYAENPQASRRERLRSRPDFDYIGTRGAPSGDGKWRHSAPRRAASCYVLWRPALRLRAAPAVVVDDVVQGSALGGAVLADGVPDGDERHR